MSPFISVTRHARRRPAPPVIAVLLATTLLVASFALPAFGLSPTKLVSEALSTAKKADKEAKKADKDAKNSTVGTSRLQDGAVTAGKIAAGAVGNGQLADNSVSSAALASGAVTNDKLADGAVTGAKLASGLITSDKLADGAVTSAKLASGAVGSTQLTTGGVESTNLADGAVTSDKLASGSVGNSQIVPRSVSMGDLAGTNTTTAFDLPAVDANTCSTAEVSDAGAATTDFPMISFPGPTNLPLELSATVLRVDTAGSVRVKFCNGTSVDAASVTGVNIEVVTLR
jgi:hypothetical protein